VRDHGLHHHSVRARRVFFAIVFPCRHLIAL